MKAFSEQQIDDLIKLKFGRLVTEAGSPAFVSNKDLAKLFKVSESQIRRLYLERFRRNQMQKAPLLQQMSSMFTRWSRQRWGLRFLKDHEIQWIISANTLKQQSSMSLKDRSEQFQHEFPASKMNPTLLRKVY